MVVIRRPKLNLKDLNLLQENYLKWQICATSTITGPLLLVYYTLPVPYIALNSNINLCYCWVKFLPALLGCSRDSWLSYPRKTYRYRLDSIQCYRKPSYKITVLFHKIKDVSQAKANFLKKKPYDILIFYFIFFLRNFHV